MSVVGKQTGFHFHRAFTGLGCPKMDPVPSKPASTGLFAQASSAHTALEAAFLKPHQLWWCILPKVPDPWLSDHTLASAAEVRLSSLFQRHREGAHFIKAQSKSLVVPGTKSRKIRAQIFRGASGRGCGESRGPVTYTVPGSLVHTTPTSNVLVSPFPPKKLVMTLDLP